MPQLRMELPEMKLWPFFFRCNVCAGSAIRAYCCLIMRCTKIPGAGLIVLLQLVRTVVAVWNPLPLVAATPKSGFVV